MENKEQETNSQIIDFPNGEENQGDFSDLFSNEDVIKFFNKKHNTTREIRNSLSCAAPIEKVVDKEKNSATRGNPNNDNYNDIVTEKLEEMRDEMLRKLDFYKVCLINDYENYINTVKQALSMKARRITRILKASEEKSGQPCPSLSPNLSNAFMRQYTYKNVFEKLDNIFEIHEKIQSSIEQNLIIMENFLQEYDLLFQDHPLQNFVKSNGDKILNSWFFSKINFEKLNLSSLIESDKIPPHLKNFIYQDTKNKFVNLTIKKSKNYEMDKKLLMDNQQILEKLLFVGLSHEDFKTVFEEYIHIDGLKFEKLNKITFKDCTMEDLSIKYLFPNLEKIFVKDTRMKFKVENTCTDFLKLKCLSLEKSNMTNQQFNYLIEEFASSDNILKNLESLSVSNNNLTLIDLSAIVNNGKKFTALKELNMENNKIYKFRTQNLACLPAVRVINLISNNFTSSINFMDIKENTKKRDPSLLILMNKNLFISNSPGNLKNYFEYLRLFLPKFDYYCKYLNFSFIFNIFSRGKILDISLNSNIQISLHSLNLSYCSLDNSTLINFFKQNSGLINLRKLDVSVNFLDDGFIDLYVNENCHLLMEKLEEINLSDNKVLGINMIYLDKLVTSHKMLTTIKLKNNPIEDVVFEYLRTKEKDNLDTNTTMMSVDSDSSAFDSHLFRLEYSDEGKNETRTRDRQSCSDPMTLFNDFIEGLLESKKEIKLVFSILLKKKLIGNSKKGLIFRQKELAKVIHFK